VVTFDMICETMRMSTPPDKQSMDNGQVGADDRTIKERRERYH